MLGLVLAVAVAACGGGQRPRPYPAPEAKTLVDHIAGLRERAPTLNAETRTDFRLDKDRVNLTVLMLAAWGGKLRFQAQDPNSSMAADLASDGKRYCFIDVHHNCAECGPATPENVARMIRIPLDPDDVIAVLLGGAPILAGTQATVEWDASEGEEVLTLAGAAATERIRLDGKDQRWDVVAAEVKSADGQLLLALAPQGTSTPSRPPTARPSACRARRSSSKAATACASSGTIRRSAIPSTTRSSGSPRRPASRPAGNERALTKSQLRISPRSLITGPRPSTSSSSVRAAALIR